MIRGKAGNRNKQPFLLWWGGTGTVDGAVLVLESLTGPAWLISKAQAKSLLWAGLDWYL